MLFNNLDRYILRIEDIQIIPDLKGGHFNIFVEFKFLKMMMR